MIYFFGLRWVSWGREYTRRVHYCIQCGQGGKFQLRTRMRFIHFFWIRLIPVSGKQPVYRCRHCGATYDRVDG